VYQQTQIFCFTGLFLVLTLFVNMGVIGIANSHRGIYLIGMGGLWVIILVMLLGAYLPLKHSSTITGGTRKKKKRKKNKEKIQETRDVNSHHGIYLIGMHYYWRHRKYNKRKRKRKKKEKRKKKKEKKYSDVNSHCRFYLVGMRVGNEGVEFLQEISKNKQCELFPLLPLPSSSFPLSFLFPSSSLPLPFLFLSSSFPLPFLFSLTYLPFHPLRSYNFM
jgi:hypothetical protein